MSSQATPGRLVRLRILTTPDLPPHPSIRPSSPEKTDIFDFVQTVLDEAVSFADEHVRQTFEPGASKLSPPATATVRLLSRDIKRSESQSDAGFMAVEPWFARISVHRNASEHGTASFAEFDAALRTEHCEHEMQYTPSIFDAHKVLDWSGEIAARNGKVPGGYEEVSMGVYEMCHQMPLLVTNRVFPVLVLSARTGIDSFVVVQIPIDLTDFPDGNVMYANGRNRRDATFALGRKKIVPGAYVSVERVRVTSAGEIEWVMATASDAKGYLPLILQRQSIPGVVLKDVGLVMQWVADNRRSPEPTDL